MTNPVALAFILIGTTFVGGLFTILVTKRGTRPSYLGALLKRVRP